MKRKLLGLITALVLAFSMTGLAACGEVPSLTLNNTSITIEVNEEVDLKATLANLTGTVEWSSDKPEYATVSDAGKVKGIAKGKATITAKAGEVSATCEVTVRDTVGDEKAKAQADLAAALAAIEAEQAAARAEVIAEYRAALLAYVIETYDYDAQEWVYNTFADFVADVEAELAASEGNDYDLNVELLLYTFEILTDFTGWSSSHVGDIVYNTPSVFETVEEAIAAELQTLFTFYNANIVTMLRYSLIDMYGGYVPVDPTVILNDYLEVLVYEYGFEVSTVREMYGDDEWAQILAIEEQTASNVLAFDSLSAMKAFMEYDEEYIYGLLTAYNNALHNVPTVFTEYTLYFIYDLAGGAFDGDQEYALEYTVQYVIVNSMYGSMAAPLMTTDFMTFFFYGIGDLENGDLYLNGWLNEFVEADNIYSRNEPMFTGMLFDRCYLDDEESECQDHPVYLDATSMQEITDGLVIHWTAVWVI